MQRKRNGRKTPHPGIRRDGHDSFTIRVAVCDPRTGRNREKERKLKGSLVEAIKERETLRAEIVAEMASEANGRKLVVERPTQRETLSVYAKRWLIHVEKTGRNRVHTIDRHVRMLETFVLPMLGDFEVAEIGRPEVAAWMMKLGSLRTKSGKPYAKASLRTAWETFRTMLHDARVLCDPDRDATDGVRFAAQGLEPKNKDVLSQQELALVLDETEHETRTSKR